MLKRFWRVLTLLLAGALGSGCAHAVEMQPVPREKPWQNLSPAELEELVGPIALYPDDLVAIVLPASTFPLQVVQAARFREQSPDGKPNDRWDGSVVALLNYPEVLKKLNGDLDWTWRLGEAVINQQPDVLKAVSAFRERARIAGNLKSDDRQVVEVREKIVYIRPVNERVIYVPYYDPWEVTSYRRHRVYHYYAQPYPVYYHPYDDYWDFPTTHFWGASSWYGIGWHRHRLHWLHHQYRHHPYYGRSYRDHGHHRRYRHQAAPAWVNDAPPAVAAGGEPVLPPDSVWQPGAHAGSRPFGDRRAPMESPVGAVGSGIPGGGGESSLTVPQDIVVPGTTESTGTAATTSIDANATPAPAGQPASATADSTGEEVVYDGQVNGEQVRVIRRGSSFETRRGPAVDGASALPTENGAAFEPVITEAPATVVQDAPVIQDVPADAGSVYGREHEAAVQAAVERAREQARQQAETYRNPQQDTDTRVWRSDPIETRTESEPIVLDSQPTWSTRRDAPEESRWERPVQEERSAPVIEERREVFREPEAQSHRGGWENDAAIQEAISRARDQGYGNQGHGNDAPREESRGWGNSERQGSWSEPSWSRESRQESREEAPARSWEPEPRFEQPQFEPRHEERSEPSYSEPSWQPEPERREEIQINDIRVEGQQ